MTWSPGRLWLHFQLWRLSKPWLGGRKWYQHIDFGDGLTTARWSAGETKLRTESFLSFLGDPHLLMEDDVVIDVGCNAGLFSLVAAQRCKRVYGVEIDPRFVRQANFLRGWWKSQGKRVDNLEFIQADITEHLDLVSEATVVLVSKVLYHTLLGNSVVQLMEAIEKGSARLLLMQGHAVPPRGPLGQNEGMRDFVNKYGFQYRLVMDVPEFPIAIATRRVGVSKCIDPEIRSGAERQASQFSQD